MTQKISRKKEMKDYVCEYFIRVCKNHDIYHVFKKSFKTVMTTRGDRNPFGTFCNVSELSNKLNDFTEREYSKHSRNDNDEYERVTMMINHMLHFFLEKGGVDPRRLGMIGQEIFDLTCYGLYGDKYIQDMERMQQNEPRPTNIKEAALLSEYMRLKKNPDFKMTWDEFLKQYIPMLSWMNEENIECEEDSYDNEDDFDEFFDEDEHNNDNNRLEEIPW